MRLTALKQAHTAPMEQNLDPASSVLRMVLTWADYVTTATTAITATRGSPRRLVVTATEALNSRFSIGLHGQNLWDAQVFAQGHVGGGWDVISGCPEWLGRQ